MSKKEKKKEMPEKNEKIGNTGNRAKSQARAVGGYSLKDPRGRNVEMRKILETL